METNPKPKIRNPKSERAHRLFVLLRCASCLAPALLAGGSRANADTVFYDDFNGFLNPAWSIVREDASYYSVQSTGLVLRCNSGDIWTYRTDARNLFLIANPAPGDFTVTAKLRWLVPPGSSEAQFDLLAYDDDNNHVRLAHGMLSGVLRIDNAGEINGAYSGHGLTAVNFGTSWFWLQMCKAGSTYSAWYSTDGVAFSQASSAFSYGDGTPAKLGFVAMVDPGESAQVVIDSFTVQTLGAPSLNLARSNAAVLVSWPAPAVGWLLHATTNLVSGGSVWTEIPPPYYTNGTNLQFTEPLPAGNKFYRLHRP